MNEDLDDPLARRLSRLTPAPAALDRDALLFAAGRASARTSRPLMALAGALAASQLLTLALLLPRAPLSIPEPFMAGEPAAAIEQPPLAAAPYQLAQLRQELLSTEHDRPPPQADGSLVPDDPPLHAFDAFRTELLN